MDSLDRELLELRKRIAAKATGIAPRPEAGESPAGFYGRALGRRAQRSPALAEVRRRDARRPARRRPRYRLFVLGIVLGGVGAGAAAWLGVGTGVAAGSREEAAPPPSAAEEAERDSLIREIRALEALQADDTPGR